MALWWLSYHLLDGPFGVAIIKASNLDHARMIAVIDGIDKNFTFAEGHKLDDEQAAMIKPGEMGRILFLPLAAEIQARFKQQP